MSGFVIAHAYDGKILDLGVARLMRRRVIRFYPLYAAGFAIGVARQLVLMRYGSGEMSAIWLLIAGAASMVFLPCPPTPRTDAIAPVNNPAWSLLFEIWINLAYAATARWLTIPILIVTVLLSGTMLAACRIAGLPPGGGVHWHDFSMGILRVTYSFPLGILLYRTTARTAPAWYGWIAFPIAVASFLAPLGDLFDVWFTIALSPLIVFLGSRCHIRHKISDYLGSTSYFLYAVHFPLMLLAAGVAARLGLPTAPLIFALLAALLAVAPIVDRAFDRPLRRRLSRYFASPVQSSADRGSISA